MEEHIKVSILMIKEAEVAKIQPMISFQGTEALRFLQVLELLVSLEPTTRRRGYSVSTSMFAPGPDVGRLQQHRCEAALNIRYNLCSSFYAVNKRTMLIPFSPLSVTNLSSSFNLEQNVIYGTEAKRLWSLSH